MPHWKITLSYDGTSFHGWQIQPHLLTVQGTLASALARLTGEQILPQGSGRTDAGVHALAQVASFTLQAPIAAPDLLRALNRSLPASIRILAADPVEASFHARHSALRKSYEYRIFDRFPPSPASPAPDSSASNPTRIAPTPNTRPSGRVCSPFLAPFVWDCRWPLDLDLMQQAAAQFCGSHDFTSFAASDPDLTLRASDPRPDASILSSPNPQKTIFDSTFHRESDHLFYRISGSGFLHHMVRNIVGTLVEVGRGSLSPSAIPAILAARDRRSAGPTAPASGLFLHSVEYPATPVESIPEAAK